MTMKIGGTRSTTQGNDVNNCKGSPEVSLEVNMAAWMYSDEAYLVNRFISLELFSIPKTDITFS